MEPVFHLPYSEFEAVLQFAKILPKRQGYGIFIPASRQQASVDFLILNNKSMKTLRVQVKSSRTWPSKTNECFYPWYNNFIESYEQGATDIYVFTALYPSYRPGNSVRKRDFWRTAILVFTDREIANLLPKIKTKSGKPDRFFSFEFNGAHEVRGDRGFPDGTIFTDKLLVKRADLLRKKLR